MRVLTTTQLQILFAQQTGESLLFLLRLSHASWVNDVYLVNNTKNIVSNGDTYTAFPFAIVLPAEDADRNQVSAQLTACNVSLELLQLLRAITSPIDCYISIIVASQPDDLMFAEARFQLKAFSYDVQTITATLTLEPILMEPIPFRRFSPGEFPGLF